MTGRGQFEFYSELSPREVRALLTADQIQSSGGGGIRSRWRGERVFVQWIRQEGGDLCDAWAAFRSGGVSAGGMVGVWRGFACGNPFRGELAPR